MAGIAYAPGFVKNTVSRAGFTMNYDTTYAMDASPFFTPGTGGVLFSPVQTYTAFNPGFFGPDGFGGNGLTAPMPVSTPNLTQAEARAATTGFVFDQRIPYSMNWDVSLQNQIFHRLVLDIRYLGVKTTLNDLTASTAALLAARSNAFTAAGFANPLLATAPLGWSWYNGLAVEAREHFSGGVQFQLAYTWSHLIDNMDAAIQWPGHVRQPERPWTEAKLHLRSSPARPGNGVVGHRRRRTSRAELVSRRGRQFRDFGTYTYETPAPVFLQGGFVNPALGGLGPSGVFVNPSGVAGTGSGVTPLTNSSGNIVGYLANNPNARFIAGAPGLLTPGGPNSIGLNPINKFDTAVFKRFALRDRFSFEIHAQAYNVLNHPQFTAVDIFSIMNGGAAMANLLTPGSPGFDDPSLAFSSHARILQVGLRFLW